MPRRIVEYRCLLISPSDVTEEREALSGLIARWNAQIGVGLNARIELVKWESHATPQMGGSPQDLLNEQIVQDCDLGLAVFRSRLGTPTENHESGSVEEVYRLAGEGKRVLVYFSNEPIPQEALRDDQFSNLQAVRERFQQDGLLSTFNDTADLREKVQLHLTNVITQLLQQGSQGPSADAPEVVTAPRPDVRVRAYSAIVFDTGPFSNSKTRTLLAIGIANHSPVPVFISAVAMTLKEGDQGLLLTSDAATGGAIGRRLESGESTVVSMDPVNLKEKVDLADIETIVVSDAVGREYIVPHSEVQDALDGFDW